MGDIKKTVLSSIFVTVSVGALLTAFCSVLEFTVFLSLPNFYTPAKVVQNSDGDVFWSKVFWGLFLNSALLSLFILQHSIMALPTFKKMFSSLGLDVIERNVYVILTSLALQVLVRYWQPIPDIAFWRLVPNRFTWWLLVLIHSFLWILIYVGNICADVNELLGIKQVYYHIKNLPQPQQYKSAELVRLNNHMRHPSFLAFVLLFWISATMSLDRVLLATILSTYMFVTWRTDNSDYRYVEIQYRRKFQELQRL